MVRYATKVKVDSKNPFIGHTHRPHVVEKLMGVTVRINSDGLRDREHLLIKGDRYRIIFLGDSITFGWGVEEKDSFKQILETEINKQYPVEIINFGTGNYNTEQEVNFFLEKGLKYNPEKVVVFYFINDAEITPKKSRSWFLHYSYAICFLRSRLNALMTDLISSQTFKEYYSNLYREDQEGWVRAKKAFVQLKSICDKKQIRLQVILLPEMHDLHNYPFKKEHRLIANFLQENKIEFLDLAPFFSAYKDSKQLWVAKDDPHPNKIGHRLIAEYSLDFISKRELLR